MYNFSTILKSNFKKIYKKSLYIIDKSKKNGKIQIEVERLKWTLNKKYKELGVYVVCSKENKSMTDFSQDSIYLQMLNEIIKLKYYIEERIKDKRI